MTARTGIEWTEATWNPIVGCAVVSPGCTNCYAMKMADRLEAMGTLPHYAGTTRKTKAGPVWTGKLALAPERTLLEPLRRKKPTTWFVNSMGDLFHESVPDAWIDKVFAVMALAPQHIFQVLTKRAARMRAYLPAAGVRERVALAAADLLNEHTDVRLRPQNYFERDNGFDHVVMPWPLPNVWLGVSAEDQRRADERIPDLLATPAAVRFVSAEPLLGPIDFKRWAPTGRWGKNPSGVRTWFPSYYMTKCEHCGWIGSSELCGSDSFGDDSDIYCAVCHNTIAGDDAPALDWIIVGGESGPGARPMHPQWARAIRDQCAAAGTAFFFKQWGEWAPSTPEAACGNPRSGWRCLAGHPHVAKREELYPEAGAAFIEHMGKKRAGRTLDGIEHNAMPELRR